MLRSGPGRDGPRSIFVNRLTLHRFPGEVAMSPRLASCLIFLLVPVVAGCPTETTDPSQPPPPPPAPPVARWSDGSTWPGGAVPAPGAAVVIPSGKTVLLDVSPPGLGG